MTYNFETVEHLLDYYKTNHFDVDSFTRVALYMRYSSQNQTEDSIAYQRRKILEFCAINRLYPVIEYIDEAYSGRSEQRPDFQRLLFDSMNAPTWRILLIFNLSRFCRNALIGIKCFRELRERGLEVTSVIENLPKTPEGRLMESLFHIFNEYASDINATHTHAGMTNRALKGSHCGGVPPLGFDIDKDTSRLILNATEAIVVKKIFDMYENNYSYADIADILNRDGYKTKAGNPFNKNSFDSILHQEKYTGTYTWNKRYQTSSNNKKNNRGRKQANEQVIITDGCPAIISKAQFDRVQNMLGNRLRVVKGTRTKKHYMLSGMELLKCAKCGANMYATTKNSHGRLYEVYYCPNRKSHQCTEKDLHAKQLHELIATTLADDIISRNDIHAILSLAKENNEYSLLENKMIGNEIATRNVLRALETQYNDRLSEKLQQLTAEKEKIQVRMKEIESMYSIMGESKLEEIRGKLVTLLIESNDQEVRAYLQNCIESILVDDSDVTITLRVL